MNLIKKASIRDFFKGYVLTDEERRMVWKLKIGNKLKITEDLYQGLVARLDTRPFPKKIYKLIKDDLDRTFPNCTSFKEGEKMYKKMEKLLRLFQIYRPDIGYVQGMTYLMSTLYYYFNEFDCFMLFCNLVITKPFIRSMYTFDMRVVSFFNYFLDKNLFKTF